MNAGASKIDITPNTPVFMDGMIRSQKSEGIHDRIYARALALSPSDEMNRNASLIVSVEVCGFRDSFCSPLRRDISDRTGFPYENIVIAATHTHSGPAAMGIFNPCETDYLAFLHDNIVEAATDAVESMRPASVEFGCGQEHSISHYRRLKTKDGRVIMNWEEYDPAEIEGPLGTPDPELGLVRIVDEFFYTRTIALVFTHAGHPNVMSGDNYLISGDYPGHAMRLAEDRHGGVALFLNGAEGTMDIDGRKDRDWAGVERAGTALADAISSALKNVEYSKHPTLRTRHTAYTIPRRRITAKERAWADTILQKTGGTLGAMPDGVGDDYLALLIGRLSKEDDTPIPVEQTCILIDGFALISFPGELFTEIGMTIKKKSIFMHSFVLGLANGEIGYIPTAQAILEGGYAVQTREAADEAAEIIEEESLALLRKMFS